MNDLTKENFCKVHGNCWKEAVWALPNAHWELLQETVSEDDNLLHLDDSGFSVNFGAVGSRGVRYDFHV
jgi:hypothetical protein